MLQLRNLMGKLSARSRNLVLAQGTWGAKTDASSRNLAMAQRLPDAGR